MNIAFGGMESYSDNLRMRRSTLDKYFNRDKLILFRPKAKNAGFNRPEEYGWKDSLAQSKKDEEERVILGTWLLGALSVAVAAMSLAA